jgi:UV DNA damage endonuclease
MRLGYACINNTLAVQKIQVNRSLIKKTFQAKGIVSASELALKNVADFAKIIDWNIKHRLLLYRMSSDMFPWMSEYELEELPNIFEIKRILAKIGEKAKENNLRLTYHPGPFNVLATSNEIILKNTIKELRQHSEIMDMIGLPQSVFAKINIHVGASHGDKSAAIKRFCENFDKLSDSVKSRLTVENDDKVNMYSVRDLEEINKSIGIPIVFDYLHYQFCKGDMSEEEAMLRATDTWPDGIPPIVHYSSSKKKFEDITAQETAHADYIYQYFQRYGKDVDVMLEAKAKEKAVLKYIEEYRIKIA